MRLERPEHVPAAEWEFAIRIARLQVGRLVRGLPFWIDGEAVRAEAAVALYRTAAAWDPARGRFSTYAAWRVRGFLIDEVRRQSPWPRGLQEARDRGEWLPWLEAPASLEHATQGEVCLAELLADARPGPEAEVLLRLCPEPPAEEGELARRLAALAPGVKAAVLLRESGRTWREVAAAIGGSEKRARSCYRQGLAALREMGAGALPLVAAF